MSFSFNSILKLINVVSSDLQKLHKYFDGTTIVVFFNMPLSPSDSLFCNNLALYLQDLKLLVLAISALELVASSLK